MYSNFAGVHHTYMPPKMYRRTFIRNWREDRGLTLEQLADAIGITHASLSRIERGLQPYSQTILENIAEKLKTDVPSLLARDPADPSPIWSTWEKANPSERRMIERIAKDVVDSD